MLTAPADVLILPMTDDLSAAVALASELRAGGYESLYQYDEKKDNGVAKVGLIPLDAPEEDAEDAITKDTLCYVVPQTAWRSARRQLPFCRNLP